MMTRSAALGGLALAAMMTAAPAMAQDEADASAVTRTWEIYLESGQRITFESQLNWAGAAKGPSQFLADYQAYVAGGAKPPISRYTFPAASGTTDPAADLLIDLSEVIAVVQKY